jgi:uncharacterized protein involved in exopolysaccharide biosynthesis
MLESLWRQETVAGEEQSAALSPSYFLDILRRRWLLAAVPFLTIVVVGLFATLLWPPIYLSEARILIESQQIPTDLVRPTVSQMASERIQVIEQRIMTRDKLLAIANKHQVFTGMQGQLTSTEMLDRMRERTQFKPLELKLPNSRLPAGRQTLAFTVGFEHRDPQVAMRVANEFVTLILDEDVRTRTNFASETTKFLEREVKRLDSELNQTEVQLAELQKKQAAATSASTAGETARTQLFHLRSELLQKSATYSDSHPDMKVLQQKIAALEKLTNPATDSGVTLDVLKRNQETLQRNLEGASNKLGQARLGESLERGQQSEKLEVIEQATAPQKPVRPNRPKLFAVFLGIALAVGGALTLGLEMLDGTIRRASDLYQIVDRKLVVAIPYIETKHEASSRRKKFALQLSMMILVPLMVLAPGLYLLPYLQKLVHAAFVVIGQA